MEIDFVLIYQLIYCLLGQANRCTPYMKVTQHKPVLALCRGLSHVVCCFYGFFSSSSTDRPVFPLPLPPPLVRAAEEAMISDLDENNPGTEWERVARLCDFNPKSSKQAKDVSRMRSVLISLKQSPLVR